VGKFFPYLAYAKAFIALSYLFHQNECEISLKTAQKLKVKVGTPIAIMIL